MTRNAFFALGAGAVFLLATPLAAQTAGQGAAAGPAPGAQGTAPPAPPAQATTSSAATSSAVTPANGDDPAAQATETKADPKAKAKADSPATCGTAVRAGPNQGQVIGKCKAKTDDNSTPKT